MNPDVAVWSAVERVARNAYGRLVARLAYRWNDIAAAEDALADALAAALVHWAKSGIPESPEAWLMAAAKNRLRGNARHQTVKDDAETTLLAMTEEQTDDGIARPIPDHRLNLMFACAHPAIDETVRTPLMLQAVLGLDAARIASAFAVSPAAMSQRLVRAKQKIRDARVPFEAPDPSEMTERLSAVLEGIYAAFGTGWNDLESAAGNEESLAEEALFLGQLVCELVADHPEAMGLLALMIFSHARRRARFAESGAFSPLAQQDTSLWERHAIRRADELLLRAFSYRSPGPYQLEAAIQSAHSQRLFSGITPWRSIAVLYESLNRLAPTLASQVGYAAALVEAERASEAHQVLEQIDAHEMAGSYQPFWVVSAHVARARGQAARATECLARALSLTKSPALRAHLQAQRDALSKSDE